MPMPAPEPRGRNSHEFVSRGVLGEPVRFDFIVEGEKTRVSSRHVSDPKYFPGPTVVGVELGITPKRGAEPNFGEGATRRFSPLANAGGI